MMYFVSAGCFTIHKKNNKYYVLLIHRNWNEKTVGWVPPKGKIENDEAPDQAAIRETIEETGVRNPKILEYIESSEYLFPFEGDTAKKIVHWYLAETKDDKLGELILTDHEKETLDKVEWVEINEALSKLTYENEKIILEKIIKLLSNDKNTDKYYYEKYTRLNLGHYSSEVDYYSNADLRPVEISLLGKISKNNKILDVACGPGRFAIKAAEKGYNITGTDINEAAIEHAKQSTKDIKKTPKFKVANAIDLPFKNNSFDTILCLRYSLNSIPTFNMRKKALNEMYRCLSKNGKLYIETQNMYYLGSGLSMPIINIFVRYLYRYISMFLHRVLSIKYDGLLPGDFVYRAGKIKSAPAGYLHIPSIFELKSMVPKNANYQFASIPEIINNKIDLLKYWRYSAWLIITKK